MKVTENALDKGKLSRMFEQKFTARRNFEQSIELSVVMPIFNQESSIEQTLTSLVGCLETSHELVLIDDCSEDGTPAELMKCAKHILKSPNSTQRVTIFRAKNQQFETMCDSKGFLHSLAPYVLEVQADMQLMDQGFDKRMILAIRSDKRLFMISGRGTHSFADVLDAYMNSPGAVSSVGTTLVSHLSGFIKNTLSRVKKKLRVVVVKSGEPLPVTLDEPKAFERTGRAGRLDASVETAPNPQARFKKLIFLGQTVMRGPLLVDRSKYLTLGGFDTDKFFLGFDDHELALRGWVDHGMRVGYTQVDFVAPPGLGSTRMPKSFESEIRYLMHLFRIHWTRNKSFMYRLGRSTWELPENEVVYI